MNNLEMFCICIHNDLLDKVKKLNYVPVGLGDEKFENGWLQDNTGINISNKNKFYGEYSFHYWFWKNKIKDISDDTWIGFCAYRRFWHNDIKINDSLKFKNKVLNQIPEIWNKYDVILGNQISVNEVNWIKVFKYGKLAFLRNPQAITKKGRTIKFHFDMFHGNGILDRAIDQLNDEDKEDFRKYVNNRTSYNQGNMFICKSKKIINKYYETIFNWLSKCEKIFGFDLSGYSKVRIYAFLAERFLPYWFNKYSKCLEWPIFFNDIRKENFN